jgi:hypothetical protein
MPPMSGKQNIVILVKPNKAANTYSGKIWLQYLGICRKIACIVIIYICCCTGKRYSSRISTVYLIMVYYFSNFMLPSGLSNNRFYRTTVNSLGDSTGSGIPQNSLLTLHVTIYRKSLITET